MVLTDTFAILLICSTVKRELYSLSDMRLSSATKRLDWKKKITEINHLNCSFKTKMTSPLQKVHKITALLKFPRDWKSKIVGQTYDIRLLARINPFSLFHNLRRR